MYYFSRLSIALVLISAVLSNTQAQPLLPPSVPATTESAPSANNNGLNEQQDLLKRRRAEMEQTYLEQERACYSRFLVNRCIAKVGAARRQEQAALRTEQLALDESERRLRAQQQAQQMAEQEAREAAIAPARQADEERARARYLEKQHAYQLKQARRIANASHPQAHAHKVNWLTAHQRELEAASVQAKQEALQRAQNVARFQAKQRAAENHRAEVERRQQANRERAAS